MPEKHASSCSFKCQSIAVQRPLLGWVISVACYVNCHVFLCDSRNILRLLNFTPSLDMGTEKSNYKISTES